MTVAPLPSTIIGGAQRDTALQIEGGVPLCGEVSVTGAKNAAVKHIAAALLAPGETLLRDVPTIRDVASMRRLVESVGAVTRDHGDHELAVDVPDALRFEPDPELVGSLRASLALLGPILARRGQVQLAMPGGCALGDRAVDLHLFALARLGAKVEQTPSGRVIATAARLRGARIRLPFVSVGATETALLAAVTADGESVIEPAAREPEVVDLAELLVGMGARIQGAGTSRLVVRGVPRLRPAVHTVVPDRLEAVTYAMAAAATRGKVVIDGAVPEHLVQVADWLRRIGVDVFPFDGGVVVDAPRPLNAYEVAALPYPAFPTDALPLASVVLTQARGAARVADHVFPDRFGHLDDLVRFGADVARGRTEAVVRGPTVLRGAEVRARDLRGAAAVVIAALAADGPSTITGAAHLERGYEMLPERLRSLGAVVR